MALAKIYLFEKCFLQLQLAVSNPVNTLLLFNIDYDSDRRSSIT